MPFSAEHIICGLYPGRIREGYIEEGYAKYKSQTVTAADKKRRRVDCEICGASLVARSYQSDLESQHDVFRSMVLQRDIMVSHPAVVYPAIELLGAGKYFCPVPHCVGEASTKCSKTAFSSLPPTGSRRGAERRDSPLPVMQEVWNENRNWCSLRNAPAYSTLPGGVGKEKAT